MKKIMLLAIAMLCIVFTQAQQRTSNMRERLGELNAIEDERTRDKRLTELLSGTEEDDYLLAYSYYSSKEMSDKAEEVKDQILKKFPEGQFAFQDKVQQISTIENLEEKERKFMELYAKYPDRSYGFAAFTLAQEFAAKGDEAKMKQYADIYGKGATDGRGNNVPMSSIYGFVARSMVRSNPDAAAKYLKAGVEDAKASLDDMLKDGETPNENLLIRARNNYSTVLSSYVYALALGSNPESGYQVASKIYQELQQDPQNGNNLAIIEGPYLQTLIKTNRYKEAFPLLEKVAKTEGVSGEMKDQLRKAYIAVHGSDSNFASYEKELLEVREQTILEEIAKKSINEPAHDFTLKDVDGNTVKLSDLRGKVVVLDFWATWCGPCKASFPGMQQAVNKYKNDPNVKFLFLHTWEKGGGDATVEAKKYVADNNYTFEVLMDLRDPETKQSAVASAYKVSGIPTKVVIDPKGRIRFSTSGGGSDVNKIVNEISSMVEFAKKG